MYEEELRELGLTENEVRIYLLLLEQGLMNPSEIAARLGMHRGYVYDALERMHEKEAVNFILRNNKKYFQANTPHELADVFKFKLESFQKIVPNLTEMMHESPEETSVEVHKGKRVYRTLLKDVLATLQENEEVLILGIKEELIIDVEPIYLKQYFSTIKERGISEKALVGKKGKKLDYPNITYKEVDEKYIGNTPVIVYSNKVAILILGTPRYLILIDNKEVADTYRKQFNLLWRMAK